MSEGFGGLVDYYNDFVPKHFPLPNGKPGCRRRAQKIAKRYNLKVIRVFQVALIDPIEAADTLRQQFAAQKRETPRRGRPPKAFQGQAAE